VASPRGFVGLWPLGVARSRMFMPWAAEALTESTKLRREIRINKVRRLALNPHAVAAVPGEKLGEINSDGEDA
jgi:hypothetical protein